MTSAFDFRLAGKRVLNGYRVYVLKGYKSPDRDSEVLPGMEGTLWIDRRTFQWLKVEAHVIHPVRIERFLAEVEPGTRFEVEKRPVASDIWLASHFSMKSNAKVMLLFPHKGEEDDLYFHYHKAKNAEVGQ
jgi:hypothetical protein